MDNKRTIIYTLSLIGIALLLVILFLVFNFATQTDQEADIADRAKLPESVETKESTKDNLVRTRKSLEETLSETRKAIARYIELSPKNISEVYTTVEQCGEIANSQEKDRCITLWAEHSKNIDLCNSVAAENKSKCLNSTIPKIAVENNDLSLCSSIEDGSYKQSCIYKVAVVPDLPLSVCDTLADTGERQYCQFSIIMKSKNQPQECETIADQAIKNRCFASFNIES